MDRWMGGWLDGWMDEDDTDVVEMVVDRYLGPERGSHPDHIAVGWNRSVQQAKMLLAPHPLTQWCMLAFP